MEELNRYKKKLRQFRSRLYMEAAIRAGVFGLAAGLLGAAVVLLYGRIKYKELWLSEAVLPTVVLLGVTAVLMYILRLRPGKKEVLVRMDALGLEERMITMEQLKQEETVIAKKQRQDAKERLAELDMKSLKPRLSMLPLLGCVGLAAVVTLLVLLPFPKQKVDEQATQNAQEMELVDEMITALREVIENSEVNAENKAALHEIVDALALNFMPEDTTLSRTAKIATASKRLDMLAASRQSEITLLKQDASEAALVEVEAKEAEQELLTDVIQEMQEIMGTSIEVLNKLVDNFWTPGAPSSDVASETEEPSEEGEPQEGEEPPEGEEPGEGEELPEGGEPQEGEGEAGERNGTGGEQIYDPEQGEVSYGSVYEQYYQEILKALTEEELSEEMREIIEDYANSLE